MALKLGVYATAWACAAASRAGELSVQARQMMEGTKKQDIAVTPGVLPKFEGMLNNIEQLLPLIRQGHQRTQETLDKGIGDAQSAEMAAKNGKALANAFDKSWYECVDAQRLLTVDLEKAIQEQSAIKQQTESACLQANNTRRINRALPEELRHFKCDRTNDAKACEDALALRKQTVKNEVSLLKGLVSADEQKWTTFSESCGELSQEFRDAIAEVTRIQTALSTKKGECHGLFLTRKSSFCSFASAWRENCDTKKAYNELVQATAKVKGGNLSVPDREVEWATARRAQCELTHFVDNVESECKDFSLATEVGIIDKHLKEFDELKTFTCQETTFTFDGRKWAVPLAPKDGFVKASDYVSHESHITVKDRAFAFCATPDMCSCTGNGNEIMCSVSGKRHCASGHTCDTNVPPKNWGDWSMCS